jgi:hypothetical protein
MELVTANPTTLSYDGAISEGPEDAEDRRDSEISDTEGAWFRARWHFSFDTYYDPENDSFSARRVFNDDRRILGAVWPLHPHRDVEGITCVAEGLFGHVDNVGGAYGPLPRARRSACRSVQARCTQSGTLRMTS